MSAHSRLPSEGSPVQDGPAQRSLPHTAGFVDSLGARQLVFDPASSTSLEVLRFKREFGESPDFEGALLARLEALNNVRHPSLATIQSVERLSDTELALVSRHTPGRRISELLPKAHGPAFALELIRLVTPALATLQRAGEDVAHGALSAERIVVTRDGRLVVLEYVIGPAIEALHLPRRKLNELGLVVPAAADPIQFTARTDMAQLGFIALALLLGRRLDAADYPEKIPAHLDEFTRTAGSPMLAAKLRSWLERAMQISPRSFASAKEAQAAFGDLPDDADVQAAAVVVNSLDAFPQEAVRPAPKASQHANPSNKPGSHAEEHVAAGRSVARAGAGTKRYVVWTMAALGFVAAGAGAALFVVPYLQPPTQVIEVRPPQNLAADLRAPVVPAVVSSADQPSAPPAGTSAPAAPAPAVPTAGPAAVSTAAAASAAISTPTPAPAPPSGPRFGGMTVTSAMELQVFENGKLIGSTAGPIAINEGTRAVEFVNETLGFRYRQTVNVKGGQMTTVNIAVPNGRISINAAPWAEVDIDGKPAGETPLANLSLPIGTHEVTFRHPQFGVKKQTVVIKVDGMTRVTQVFQPGSLQ